MSNPNKAYIPPSSNAVKGGSGIYVPSFPLQFKLSDPNVTSNIVQTLSTLTSEVATTKKKLQGVEVVSSKALAVANKETNGVPQALWSLDVTQTAQMKASYTNDFISCSFTYNTKDPNFGFVRIYVTGLNGGTEPIQVASGATSPITFDMDATGQTVTITAQVVSNGGVSQPFADAVTASLTLNGFSSATGGTQTGYGPLGWPSVYNTTYGSAINFGSYGYSGMSSTFAGGLTTYFYGRFTGYLIPSTTGEYTIGVNSDDGANLYICGQLAGSNNLINSRAMAGNLTYSSGSSCTVLLNAGTYYPIVIEWQQGASSWGLQLLWTTPGGSAALIPAGNLSTSNSSVTSSLNVEAWQGTSGLWHPAIGSGYVDPGNKTIFGPPTNSGGTNVVNSVSPATTAITTGSVSPNTFIGPGWLKGQAYSSGGIIDTLICVGGTNTGYMFRCDFRASNPLGYILKVTSKSAGTWSTIGTTYVGNNAAAITGWVNFDIYIGFNGYMSLWVNNNLAADVTDLTYDTIPPSGYAGNEVQYGYEVSTGKVAPAPNPAGAGSTGLNPQGSIATVSDYTFSYAYTSTTITWSWTAFNVYCPDGSTISVPASTGSATTYTNIGTTVVAATPMEWTGLTASTTYYFTPFVVLNYNGTGSPIVAMMVTGTSAPTLVQQVQNCNADGSTPCSGSIYVTASTSTSGSGSGGSGGGASQHCFSPNTKVKTQRGDVEFRNLIPEQDKVLTARGTWKTVSLITSIPRIGSMLDMGNDELSTLTHHALTDRGWVPMEAAHNFPVVDYDGTIHNIHIETDEDDDGTALDTEHSYTLSNGLVVHNVQTAP